MIQKPPCKHCGERTAVCKPGSAITAKRGLCWFCASDPEIRDRYPSKQTGRPRKADDAKEDRMTDQMTAAELDAFVEANRETMPAGTQMDGPRVPVGKAGLFKRV